MLEKHPKKGDLIYVDFPGTFLHLRHGLVLEKIQIWGETEYMVLLSNPPEHHPCKVMLRWKWVKKIEKQQKLIDKLKKYDIVKI